MKFSPVRPLLFGVTTSNGYVILFDLEETVNKPVAIVLAELTNESDDRSKDSKKKSNSIKSSGSPLTNLAFNHKQRDLIAACDWNGKIYVWKMSWSLTSVRPNEQEFLNNLGNLAAETDD